jgi:hypothetical protein
VSKKVCVLYGINEGPAIAAGFLDSLRAAGFSITSDARAADIIFAHSGGCFLVPARHRAQVVVLIGLPYWPGRSWIVSTAKKVWREAKLYHRRHKHAEWVRKWAHHLRYSTNLGHDVRMGINRPLTKPWNSPQHQYIVRNRHDEYCAPSVANLPYRGPRTFLSLPGEHDDCWEHPERYAHLLQSLVDQEAP